MARPAGKCAGVAHPPSQSAGAWSLESFPWSRQPGVNRKQMRAFAELDFVAQHENLVLVGQPA